MRAHEYADAMAKTWIPGKSVETIRLTKQGIWFSDQDEITHEPTKQAFFRSIQQDKDGYFLKMGSNTKRIEVEDTAYFVVALEGNAGHGYTLQLSDGSREKLVPTSLSYKLERLVCRVKEGRFEARFLRNPYHEFLHDLKRDEQGHFLILGGEKIPLD